MGNTLTEGKPLVIIIKFMLPLLTGNVFQQFYNMVDTIIVGKFVGTSALAAVGSTGTIMFLVLGIANGMSTGFTVLTSQKFGAKQYEETRETVANGILLSAIVIVVLTALSLFFMHPILRLMNTPEDIYDDAYSYISVICMGIAAIVAYNLFSAFLRAVGNSRIPLYSLVFSALLNIVLDVVFNSLLIFPARETEIFGHGFRLPGAGLGVALVMLFLGGVQLSGSPVCGLHNA